MGTFRSCAYCTSSSSKPGHTMNSAPASTARSICSFVVTVPAPRSISGRAACIRRSAVSAPSARKVTSPIGMPPLHKLFPKFTASLSGCFNLITGTIPTSLILSAILSTSIAPFRHPAVRFTISGQQAYSLFNIILFYQNFPL